MKKAGLLLLVFVVLLPVGFAQGTGKKGKDNNFRFMGKWRGAEVCTDVSAPVSLMFITPDNTAVKLSGLYSVQGYINGTISGDTITIARQIADDANFENLQIEGRLVFGINPFSLSGTIYVLNNGRPDTCLVKYYK